MDDQDKPPLMPYVYEEIAKSLYKIDKSHRVFLLELRVSHPGEPGANFSPSPPRQPEHLRTAVCFYACELFKTEANEYPVDPQINHWLSKLQQRVIENVISTIKSLDNSFFSRFLGTEGKYGLSWHGLSLDDMRQSMNESLDELRAKTLASYQSAIARETEGYADSQLVEESNPQGRFTSALSESMRVGKQADAYAASGVDIASGSPLMIMAAMVARGAQQAEEETTLSAQIRRLQNECGISAEEMAEALGIEPRSIYKHLAGQTVPRRNHLAAYEKLFSERLNKSVTLRKSVIASKRQRT